MEVGGKAPRLPSHETGSIDAVYDGHRFDGAVGRERGMVKMSSAGRREASLNSILEVPHGINGYGFRTA